MIFEDPVFGMMRLSAVLHRGFQEKADGTEDHTSRPCGTSAKK